ncbi:MAG: isoprenyl transferase [Bryobacteraceae bacterium]
MKALFETLEPGARDWQLASAIDASRLPSHVAIIMDGNGRWAGQRSLPRAAGHMAGIDAVRDVVETCARLDLGYLTLYAFSVENWKRPRPEVETLWRLLRIYVGRELPRLMNNNIRLNAIGRWDVLPERAREDLAGAISKTAANTGLQLTLALNYGGRAELADAFNRIAAEMRAAGSDEPIDEDRISRALYTSGMPDPDLLIRTSGEMRISNFLLWQIAYAELYVTDVLWPDFRRRHLLEAIVQYQKRDRRFGGLTRDGKAAEELVGAAAPIE